MSKCTRKQIQDNVQYPDLSLVIYGTQPATEPAHVFKSGPETTHAAEKVKETKQKIARVKKSAARKAEDQQDEEDRAKLLSEGALNARHYARTSPVPDAIKAYYSNMPVIQSFQKLWANPQASDPKALKSLERYNDIMEEEIEAYVPQDESRTRPERWYISQWKLPIQEFLAFAVGAKKVIAAKQGGSDEQAF
ncbi:MAG: hypothetical protein L6R42_000069 [Xanthoria sp. 1 TBL-2021]|nr:MAG: hypothetical protein L6R42_000069 [Xanthoria sp. 1 TBL-2021]